MLANVSYNNKELTKQINDLVGKPYQFLERFKLGGVGSPKLWINSSSEEIDHLLSLDKYINAGNIELRPNGIIFRFRSILETYAVVIPYYTLSIFKGKEDEYGIYSGAHFVKIQGHQKDVVVFIKRLQSLKASYSNRYPNIESI